MALSGARQLVLLRSKKEPWAYPERKWWAANRRRIRCPKCWGPSRSWSRKPVGIDVVLCTEPKGSICWLDSTTVSLVRRDLHERLKDLAHECYFGDVYLATKTGKTKTNYVSWMSPTNSRIKLRGTNAVHDICPGCGQLVHLYGSERVVVRRALDQRKVHVADLGELVVERGLFNALRSRFPDLTSPNPMRVVDEPLDGQTLPGDPGWTGKFKSRFKSKREQDRFLKPLLNPTRAEMDKRIDEVVWGNTSEAERREKTAIWNQNNPYIQELKRVRGRWKVVSVPNPEHVPLATTVSGAVVGKKNDPSSE